MPPTMKLPISSASRKGVAALVELSQVQRVALTSHGQVVAVVDSPERLDEQTRAVRQAVWAVLEAAAELTVDRQDRYSLKELCDNVGVDMERVRARAARIRAKSDPG